MKNTITKIFAVLALTAILLTSFTSTQTVQAAADSGRRGPGASQRGTGTQMNQQLSLNTLSATEAEGLQSAIQEEYTAVNTYNSVIATLGTGTVFDRIVRSEQRQVDALILVAERHGVTVPENAGLVADFNYTILAEACELARGFEFADADLYTQLLSQTENPALTRVYTNLQSASLNKHVPAFELCW